MKLRNAATALIALLMCFAVSAEPLFTESLAGTSSGVNKLAEGYLPVSFSVRKSGRIQILGEGDDKAVLTFTSSYSLSNITEYLNYDMETGLPLDSWVNNGSSWIDTSIEYFNPAASMSLSLSQKFDEWTYSASLNSRFSFPQEKLIASVDNSFDKLVFSKYENGGWKKKYSSMESVYAYPWLYGDRTNLTSWLGLGASRSIYTIYNLSSLNLSLSFEAGPWWMLNKVSNGGITLSDYCRLGLSCSQSMLLKDEEQSISLRWLRISLSHSNGLSYTFGKITPQNRLNSFRLRGTLSDNVSLTFSGPQMLNSGTSVSMTLNLGNYLFFGGFQNEKSGKSMGLAYTSSLSCSFSLSLFGFISFRYGLTWNTADGYSSPDGLYGSSEVSMSFNL